METEIGKFPEQQKIDVKSSKYTDAGGEQIGMGYVDIGAQ